MPGAFQFLGKEFFVGQDSLVFGGENLVGQVVQSVVSLCRALFRAENEADRRVFAGLGPIVAGVIQVEVHLAGVGVAEFSDLQVGQKQAAQTAVEENKIDAKPVVVEAEPPLTADESEIVAQLQQEVGEMPDECLFQIRFRILVLKVQKFEDEWALMASSGVIVSDDSGVCAFSSMAALFLERAMRS